MSRKPVVRLLGIDLPMWVGRTLSTLGVGTVIYGLIRYTFIGEYFERIYQDTLGHSPIDDLKDSFDPRKDMEVLKDDAKMLEDSLG